MRIAYLARWGLGHESGILKKMAAQMRTWMRMGHSVHFFAFSPDQEVWPKLDDIPRTVRHGDNLLTRLTGGRGAQSAVESWNPDVVYLRWSTYYPGWDRVADRFPTVIELNGDDVQNNRLTLPYPLYVAHRLTRSRILKRARGFVSVSRDLARNPIYARYELPTTVIGNGVDFSEIEQLPAPSNPSPRLVFLGYGGAAWHGLDKLAALAERRPTWEIDIVGAERDAVESPAGNLRFHGRLDREDYLGILRRADVAVGSLAFHRQGIGSTSAIKTGEYLAHGIPTIIGYEETELPEGHPLVLQLPNTPDNVEANIGEIEAFVHRARGQRVDRASIAAFDLRATERARLEFLRRFVDAEAE